MAKGLALARCRKGDLNAKLPSRAKNDIRSRRYIIGDVMQVGRWGNSLAIRLPAAVVEALKLREGDQVAVEIADTRTLRVERDRSREEALARLRALAVPLPPGFRFSRDEANQRGHED